MTAFRASTPSLENARGNYRVLEIKNMKLVERVERAPTFSDVSFGTYKMLSPDVAPTRKSAVEPDWVQGAWMMSLCQKRTSVRSKSGTTREGHG